MDNNEEVVVSFSQWKPKSLVEIRANTFASRYLLPPTLLKKIPVNEWDQVQVVRWATELKVSTAALAIGLKESKIIDESKYVELTKARVSQSVKTDPELEGLTARSLDRKRALLQHGLSFPYVSLCFDAISEQIITNARAAEMLMVDENELSELAEMFGVRVAVHD
jgi:Zn-dependent peptidase ImmA (M78 family)